MLIPRKVSRDTRVRQGCRNVSFAELRRCLADPSSVTEEQRQRLQELTRRAAGVRALGDEYAGIEVSRYVTAATDRHAVMV